MQDEAKENKEQSRAFYCQSQSVPELACVGSPEAHRRQAACLEAIPGSAGRGVGSEMGGDDRQQRMHQWTADYCEQWGTFFWGFLGNRAIHIQPQSCPTHRARR